MQNYVDLHRHAAVRTALLDHPGAALRLMVAHAIVGSGLWTVRVEPQRAANEVIAASIAASKAQAAFAGKQRAVLALLGAIDEDGPVAGGNGDDVALASVFARLLALSDEDALRILALVMAETLSIGTAIVEALGNHLGLDMRGWWQPGDAFFELLRDRQVANEMLADIGGRHVADANSSQKLKTQKKIIRDFLSGENGREQVDGWLPAGWRSRCRATPSGAASAPPISGQRCRCCSCLNDHWHRRVARCGTSPLVRLPGGIACPAKPSGQRSTGPFSAEHIADPLRKTSGPVMAIWRLLPGRHGDAGTARTPLFQSPP
ncbi:hypothetical protein P9272_34420 [Mesorhizobium sp. WSM4976]|uniref:hypothetical protein n=1 Tax=Mesorhizobium sp. WSM4976 TaxID=3038549 RepID=UPI002416D226|nr:hypothetical protein [Mesorhizobium sp. WSM4976]MDG4898615.1 hypothetical protein [Mesorhizobium sp. WSM4976]